jgi:hypothetical protein
MDKVNITIYHGQASSFFCLYEIMKFEHKHVLRKMTSHMHWSWAVFVDLSVTIFFQQNGNYRLIFNLGYKV